MRQTLVRFPSGIMSILAFAYALYTLLAWQPLGGRRGGGAFPPGSVLWWGMLAGIAVLGIIFALTAVRGHSPMGE
ncbi:MAG: hypothetical protein AB7K52_09135 [Phycisphaerales bacterium]